MPGFPTPSQGDPEAGLFNSAEIPRLMRSEFERGKRYREPLVLMLVSVDRLGHLKDLYGVDAATEILRSVMDMLRTATRDYDYMRCQQGERIVALFPHTDMAGARIVAERLLENARGLKFDTGGPAIQISISIGMAGNHGGQLARFEDMQQSAESGLQLAGAAGGDRVLESEAVNGELRRLTSELQTSAGASHGAELELLRQAIEFGVASGDPLVQGKIRELFQLVGDRMPGSDRVEQELVELALGRMEQDKRAELLERSRAHEREIELLERRISKLLGLLGVSERELERLAKAPQAVDAGLASIYRTVQGLAPDADQAEKKREMLMKIFDANVALRKLVQPRPT
jgi:diguanylate cyclase (GGDEF)-like protein